MNHTVCKAALFTLLFVTSISTMTYAEDLFLVAETAEMDVYLDIDTIQANEYSSLVTAWSKTEKVSGRTVLTQMAFDCQDDTIQVKRMVAYDSSGELIDDVTLDASPRAVSAGTKGSDFLRVGCTMAVAKILLKEAIEDGEYSFATRELLRLNYGDYTISAFKEFDKP